MLEVTHEDITLMKVSVDKISMIEDQDACGIDQDKINK
jgi:hypothetical protein